MDSDGKKDHNTSCRTISLGYVPDYAILTNLLVNQLKPPIDDIDDASMKSFYKNLKRIGRGEWWYNVKDQTIVGEEKETPASKRDPNRMVEPDKMELIQFFRLCYYLLSASLEKVVIAPIISWGSPMAPGQIASAAVQHALIWSTALKDFATTGFAGMVPDYTPQKYSPVICMSRERFLYIYEHGMKDKDLRGDSYFDIFRYERNLRTRVRSILKQRFHKEGGHIQDLDPKQGSFDNFECTTWVA